MNNIYAKLSNIQAELKAPKSQYNDFGKYPFRSCEDILEAVKPICKKHDITLIVYDSVEMLGERYYIKATAELIDIESGERVQGFAYARESLQKKGMDEAQITGSTSSYARKYALNGLFNIDDNKDFDTNEIQYQSGNQININDELNKRGKRLYELGVDLTAQGSLNFISKYNNGKTDINVMNYDEKLNYIRVLDKMIEIKEKENAK